MSEVECAEHLRLNFAPSVNNLLIFYKWDFFLLSAETINAFGKTSPGTPSKAFFSNLWDRRFILLQRNGRHRNGESFFLINDISFSANYKLLIKAHELLSTKKVLEDSSNQVERVLLPWDDKLRCGCLFSVKSLIWSDSSTQFHDKTIQLFTALSRFNWENYWATRNWAKLSDKVSRALVDWLIRQAHIVFMTHSINYNFRPRYANSLFSFLR